MQHFRYAVQYNHVLASGNLIELFSYSDSKRRHIMKALAAYSKYIGEYEKWQQIRKNYQLKWSSGADSLAGFNNIIKENGDFDKMVNWIQIKRKEYPRFDGILLFNVLTGLRPQEAIDSFNLLLSHKRQEYLSEDMRLLQHFKFPDMFIRRTKKAYISLITKPILSLLENEKQLTYDMIRLSIYRHHEQFNMAYCRKIFATFLRNEGIESEIIDLLQGRIPNSIFVRHYYRPQLETIYNRVAGKLDKLNDLIRV
jgi:intergrase/recombinase